MESFKANCSSSPILLPFFSLATVCLEASNPSTRINKRNAILPNTPELLPLL